MKRIFTLTLLWISMQQVWSQATYHFQEGLAVGPCTQYGREAIYTDQLAYQLYKGTLARPAAGTTLYQDDKGVDIKWKSVKADTSHRFRGDAFSSGYIYLSYESKKEQVAVLNVTGHDMIFVNGAPRGGDMYRYGWMNLPVLLKKGKNEFYARVARFGRFGGVAANLTFPDKPVALLTADLTLPDIVPGNTNDSLYVGIVVQNNTNKALTGLQVAASLSGKQVQINAPVVPALSLRKIPVLVNGSGVQGPGKNEAAVTLMQNGKVLDKTSVTIEAVAAGKQYSRTFLSALDGSVQYYAVSPQVGGDKPGALFLSVHGAEVQAINQARAYKPKDWGTVVAPTNRRPRGFNWEDWGRLDALEVFAIAKKRFNPDPSRIYLTGHSMGGHGTWFLGATYPGNWAAIAPSAGYPTLSSYGSHDGIIPDSARSPMEAMLLRASNPSNVLALTSNYRDLGVYVAHGDADKTVPVTFARQMRGILSKFHRDFSYYEHIGGEHWYGDISVDWPPLFNFFSWHSIPQDTAVTSIDFKTASPGISANMRWAGILQQQHPLSYSRIQLRMDKAAKTISGTTSNIAVLSLNLGAFSAGSDVKVQLDSLSTINIKVADQKEVFLKNAGRKWELAGAPGAGEKNPLRSGTFKDAFRNKMVFVYATGGASADRKWAFEKAQYDAETWYYRGNGAVDLVPDRDFDPAKYPDRGVILYGNQDTNLAWSKLLAQCPVKVRKGLMQVGDKQYTGENLAAYFVYPRADSPLASVGVITATGTEGFKAANANQYFAGGSGFPDLMVFSLEMLRKGATEVKTAGFFGNDWSVEKGEFVNQ